MFLSKAWRLGSMEVEVEAVDGRLKEAEAKEKFTAVTSLARTFRSYS